MASLTRPERTLSSKKLKMPNFGCNSFPVRERPPSAVYQYALLVYRLMSLTNETFEVIAVL